MDLAEFVSKLAVVGLGPAIKDQWRRISMLRREREKTSCSNCGVQAGSSCLTGGGGRFVGEMLPDRSGYRSEDVPRRVEYDRGGARVCPSR